VVNGSKEGNYSVTAGASGRQAGRQV
jgi:hypothetical protein